MISSLGVAGLNGAGKDSIGNYLADTWCEAGLSARHISLSDALRLIVRSEQGLAPDAQVPREELGATSDRLVKEHNHAGAVVLVAAEILSDQGVQIPVFSSIRRVGEARAIHEMGGYMLFATADDEARFSRVRSRERGDEGFTSVRGLIDAERLERFGKEPFDDGVMNVEAVREYVRHASRGFIVPNNEGQDELYGFLNASGVVSLPFSL